MNTLVDYNNVKPNQLLKQGWKIIQDLQFKSRTNATNEITEAIGLGRVLTDLQEIYTAAIDGRGDLLIVHQDFIQPVLMTSYRTFDILSETTKPNVIDDITSNIAWEVLSKKGRVVFTSQLIIKEFGKIALKTRY